jgi:hypothetical protein
MEMIDSNSLETVIFINCNTSYRGQSIQFDRIFATLLKLFMVDNKDALNSINCNIKFAGAAVQPLGVENIFQVMKEYKFITFEAKI